MHPYSSHDAGRWRVPLALAAISVGLAFVTSRALTALRWDLWWLDAPAVLGYYGALRALFERRLWRWHPFRAVGLVDTPNFAGTWTATISSSHDAHALQHDGVVTIAQSWTRISIRLETKSSASRSVAAMVASDEAGAVLYYQFRNDPRAGAINTMAAHAGAVELRLNDAGQVLDGDYFTGRGRENYGRIHLERAPTRAGHVTAAADVNTASRPQTSSARR